MLGDLEIAGKDCETRGIGDIRSLFGVYFWGFDGLDAGLSTLSEAFQIFCQNTYWFHIRQKKLILNLATSRVCCLSLSHHRPTLGGHWLVFSHSIRTRPHDFLEKVLCEACYTKLATQPESCRVSLIDKATGVQILLHQQQQRSQAYNQQLRSSMLTTSTDLDCDTCVPA